MLVVAASVALLALLVAVELGQIPVRLPFPPGVEYDYMQEPPPGALPLHWNENFKVIDTSLSSAEYILKDQIVGVETVALAADGRLGLVDKYGQIFIATPNTPGSGYTVPTEPIGWSSPGRTLGVKFDEAGHLYMANAPLGLLQLQHPGDPDNQKLIVVTGRVSDESALMAGYPLEFANSLDIATNGTVYFSTSTDVLPYKTPYGYWETSDSVFVSVGKGSPSGMLLAYHPSNGSTICLMNTLWFGNGVALAHDEEFVLVADSIQMKIYRYWLKGPQAGSSDVFIDNLPGPPDGVSKAADGEHYWITIYCGAPKLLAYSHFRLVRLLLAWMPRIMRLVGADFPNVGIILKVDGQGKLVQVLGDPSGTTVSRVTSAFESPDGKLFLGSLHKRGVPVVDLKTLQG